MCFFELNQSKDVSFQNCYCPLDRRGGNLLDDFARTQVTQPVLHCFLEHDGIAADLQHVAVEDGVVLTQKVSFVEAVDDDGNLPASDLTMPRRAI